MQPSLLHIVLSDGAAKAVCWTLVHSTWEGIAAALLAGVIILITRKRPAAFRYNLLMANLVLFLLAAMGTFKYELSRAGRDTYPTAIGNTNIIPSARTIDHR